MVGVAPSISTEYGDCAYLGIRSDAEDPSTFAVPNTDPGGMLISFSILYQLYHQLLFIGVPLFTSPAYKDRGNWSTRSDDVDLFMFEVPITALGSMLVSVSILYQQFINYTSQEARWQVVQQSRHLWHHHQQTQRPGVGTRIQPDKNVRTIS